MIKVNEIIIRTALREVAGSVGTFLGNDIYYLKKFVDMMINVIGEEKLVEMLKEDNSPNKKRTNELGNKWFEERGMKYKLRLFDRIIEKTKVSYDLLEDPTLKKKCINYNNFCDKAMYLPAIKEDFMALFVFIILQEPISNYSLKPEDVKSFENKGYKHVDNFDKKRIGEHGNRYKE